MTESPKWPKHIEACIKASLELGPDVRFKCIGHGTYPFHYVMSHPDFLWTVLPLLKPDIEQWGNEYHQYDKFIVPGTSFTYWSNSFDACINNRLKTVCLAMHYRIIDGETGRVKSFKTLKVFDGKAADAK